MDILATVSNITLWGMKPLLEKQCIEVSSPSTISLLRYLLGGVISFILILILNKHDVLKQQSWVYVQMIFVAMIAFIALYFNYYLLDNYDAGYVSAALQPLTIMFTVIVGILFYGEEFNYNKMIGSLIICLGLYVLLMNKK
tara:strand:- start:571 stop:993 length:423 start_codon:yes stop_codon:yes gene_type:complete